MMNEVKPMIVKAGNLFDIYIPPFKGVVEHLKLNAGEFSKINKIVLSMSSFRQLHFKIIVYVNGTPVLVGNTGDAGNCNTFIGHLDTSGTIGFYIWAHNMCWYKKLDCHAQVIVL